MSGRPAKLTPTTSWGCTLSNATKQVWRVCSHKEQNDRLQTNHTLSSQTPTSSNNDRNGYTKCAHKGMKTN
eukprot:40101-Amphidinium_carterae.1